ncbi:hypothetical protein L873DRAFT_1802492 [Choiromyces venosus 120613-1]|uniref:Uncharacterized protein n=1 Tax=Choiromyces venosus 120613-1 TaxID=1336337 RepID=A0A3N4JUS6_9PEZI|nr:hypothetical protein L873DRAFT_1802492 [Choiromyces venosus 120613-1]
MTTQHSWGGPDGQYTPLIRSPIFTTITITYYTSGQIPETLVNPTPTTTTTTTGSTTALSLTPAITTTATATTTLIQTTPSIITVTVSVFRPFPEPSDTPASASETTAFGNNRTYWENWSPGHRAGLIVGILGGLMAAALVLFCMVRRRRKERRDAERGMHGSLWRGEGEDDDEDDDHPAAAAPTPAPVGFAVRARTTSRGSNRSAIVNKFSGNKKHGTGNGLQRDGIGRAHKVDIHRISDPVFLSSSRRDIDSIEGIDQRPAGAPLSSERPDWPLPMGEVAGGSGSFTTTTTTASGQKRVFSKRGQSSKESPSIRAVNYAPLPAGEMSNSEEAGRGIAKGGRRLQRKMRR